MHFTFAHSPLLLTVHTQTLERSYLLRINDQVIERPQHMLMRVSVGIHKENIDAAIATYHMMSERWFTHASPTLFNRCVCVCVCVCV